MESSKMFGDDGAEECESSESGWTMYIGSPMDDEYEEDYDGHANDDVDGVGHGMMKKNVYVDDEYEHDGSDDSMASDASSGPSHLQHQQQPWEGNGEGGHGHDHDHDHDHDHGMAHKKDKVKKQVKKKKKKNKTGFEAEEKEKCLVDEKRGIVSVQSGNIGRARYIGKRK